MENNDYLKKQLITYIGNKRRLLDFIESSVLDIRTELGRKLIVLEKLLSGESKHLLESFSSIHDFDINKFSIIEIKKSTIFPCEVAYFKNIDLKLESGYLLNQLQINFN